MNCELVSLMNLCKCNYLAKRVEFRWCAFVGYFQYPQRTALRNTMIFLSPFGRLNFFLPRLLSFTFWTCFLNEFMQMQLSRETSKVSQMCHRRLFSISTKNGKRRPFGRLNFFYPGRFHSRLPMPSMKRCGQQKKVSCFYLARFIQ